jgi:pimeloyl-ACP methyl ester carboxylesterase
MVLVLLHGIGGASWEGLAAALPGHELLDWPLPGYGGSAMLPETSFPALSRALQASLAQRGLAQVDLLGHSIGGMLAQDFALTFPGMVRRLILYATTPAFGGRDPSFAEAFLAARLGPLEGHSMAEAAPQMLAGMFGPEADPAALPRAIAAQAAVPEAAYRATLRCLTTFDRRADLPRLPAGTTLIAGAQDQAAPLKTMRRMAEAMPQARLCVVEQAGHLLHLERPDTFAALVRQALA